MTNANQETTNAITHNYTVRIIVPHLFSFPFAWMSSKLAQARTGESNLSCLGVILCNQEPCKNLEAGLYIEFGLWILQLNEKKDEWNSKIYQHSRRSSKETKKNEKINCRIGGHCANFSIVRSACLQAVTKHATSK